MQGGHFLPNEGLDARALSLAATFLLEIQKADDLVSVEALLASAAHELGFRYYAMIHHDDHREASPGLINMNNYPPDYVEEYFSGLYLRADPVIHACIAANACFTWCEMGDLIELGPQHRAFLERGEYHGVTNGITVPASYWASAAGHAIFAARSCRDASVIRSTRFKQLARSPFRRHAGS